MTMPPRAMGPYRPLLFALAWACLLAGAAGCQTGAVDSRSGAGPDLVGAPDWVTQGCARNEIWICGVGDAAGLRNRALCRSAAIGRARTAIARELEARVIAILRDYASNTSRHSRDDMLFADDRHLVDVGKQIADVTLAGTEVIDTWISRDEAYYALVSLEVEAFAQAVSRMTQLSEHVRTAVIERADTAFANPQPPSGSN